MVFWGHLKEKTAQKLMLSPRVGTKIGKKPTLFRHAGRKIGKKLLLLPRVGTKIGKKLMLSPRVGAKIGKKPMLFHHVGTKIGRKQMLSPCIEGKIGKKLMLSSRVRRRNQLFPDKLAVFRESMASFCRSLKSKRRFRKRGTLLAAIELVAFERYTIPMFSSLHKAISAR